MSDTDTDLLAKMGTDAARWANEFENRFPDKTPDWGTLVAWFANAIEAGRIAETTRTPIYDDEAAAEFYADPANRVTKGPPVRRKGEK